MAGKPDLSEAKFLTVAEVATMMRVSKMTVYRLVHAGDLPAVRVGRSFRVREKDANSYLSSSYYDASCAFHAAELSVSRSAGRSRERGSECEINV